MEAALDVEIGIGALIANCLFGFSHGGHKRGSGLWEADRRCIITGYRKVRCLFSAMTVLTSPIELA